MAKAYSEDLREKVISRLMSGCSKREVSRVFDIGEASIYRWLKLHEAGDLKPKQSKVYPARIDVEKLKEYVKDNPDHTLNQIGNALGFGEKTIWTWLKRLNITRKKRQHSTKNVTKKNAVSLANDSSK